MCALHRKRKANDDLFKLTQTPSHQRLKYSVLLKKLTICICWNRTIFLFQQFDRTTMLSLNPTVIDFLIQREFLKLRFRFWDKNFVVVPNTSFAIYFVGVKKANYSYEVNILYLAEIISKIHEVYLAPSIQEDWLKTCFSLLDLDFFSRCVKSLGCVYFVFIFDVSQICISICCLICWHFNKR